jgi:D-arabinose 1-dehydrogenase-like Zn-dependent alcohol dehydrogenase
MGSLVGTTRELIELVGLVKRGQIKLADVERRPMSAAEASLADLAAGRVIGRMVLEAESGAS